jgi:hypothetical protein
MLLRLAGVKTQLLAATDNGPSPIAQGPSIDSPVSITHNAGETLMGFNAAKFGLMEPSEIGATLAEVDTIAIWKSKRIALILEGTSPNSLIDRGLEVVMWPLSRSGQDDAIRRLASLLN